VSTVATAEDESTAQEKFVYKLMGSKGSGERVDRVVLEGTTANPVRYIDLGGEAEMTEEEAKQVSAEHYVRLRKQGEADDDDNEGDEAPAVETKEQQQRAQAATTESAPADLNVKTEPPKPRSRGAGSNS
jgi:hypothetical protein